MSDSTLLDHALDQPKADAALEQARAIVEAKMFQHMSIDDLRQIKKLGLYDAGDVATIDPGKLKPGRTSPDTAPGNTASQPTALRQMRPQRRTIKPKPRLRLHWRAASSRNYLPRSMTPPSPRRKPICSATPIS